MDGADSTFPPETPEERAKHDEYARDYGLDRILDPESFERLMRTL